MITSAVMDETLNAENQMAFSLAAEHDPNEVQTGGVLTKCDRIQGDEHIV